MTKPEFAKVLRERFEAASVSAYHQASDSYSSSTRAFYEGQELAFKHAAQMVLDELLPK